MQIYNASGSQQAGTIDGTQHGAATGRDNQPIQLGNFSKQLGLPHAEPGFPFDLENGSNGYAVPRLDFAIEIEKLHFAFTGQTLA